MKGHHTPHTEETKQKIREKLKSYIFTDEHKRNLRKSGKGKPKYWLGKKMSVEHREKMKHPKKKWSEESKLKHRGKNNHLWKGGISRNINGNWKSRVWRHKIYERDNYTCQECGIRSGVGNPVYLEAHHIKSWAKFPRLRYVLNNGITLCRECHKLTDSYKGKNNGKNKNNHRI